MISCSVSQLQQLKVERWSATRPTIALFEPCKNKGRYGQDDWVDSSSSTYDRISGMHLLAGLAAAAESRVPLKNTKERKNERKQEA